MSISTPWGSYTPPGGTNTEANVSADITSSLLPADATKQANLDALATSYTQAKATLDNAITQALTDANNNASQATLNADISALQTAYNSFNTVNTSYQQAASQLDSAANKLLAANYVLQGDASTNANTNFNAIVTDLQGRVSSTLLSQITSTKNSVNTARQSVNTAVSTLSSQGSTVLGLRESLVKYQASISTDKAAAILNNGSPPPSSQWQTLSTQAAASDTSSANTTQSQLTTALSTRANNQTTLLSAITSLDTALNDPTTGLVPLLQQASTQSQVSVTAYVNQLNSDLQTFTTTVTAALIAQEQATEQSDALLQTTHYANHPQSLALLQSEITAAEAQLSAAQSRTATSATQFSPSDISLPTLPKAGQDLSMADLMRFITNVQVFGKHLTAQLQDTDNTLNNLRISVWRLLVSLINLQIANSIQSVDSLKAADTSYDATVTSDNTTRQAAAQFAATTAASSISTINTRIALVNQNNQTASTNTSQIISDLNSASASAVDILNKDNVVNPNTINYSDLFNQDATASTPQTLQATTVPTPAAPATLALLSTPPTPPATTASQSQIDQYNQGVLAWNQAVYSIRTVLNTGTDPTTGQPFTTITVPTSLPLLVYRDSIPIESTILPLPPLFAALDALYSLIQGAVQSRQQSARKQQTALHPNSNEPGTTVAPDQRPTTGQSAVRGGVGLSTANLSSSITSTSPVSEALNAILQTAEFQNVMQNLTEQSTLIAATTTSIRPPEATPNYSRLGILSESDTTITTDTATTDLQLQAVAETLVTASGNTDNLTKNAVNLVAISPEAQNLSASDQQSLVDQIVLVQQLSLLTFATVATASIGTNIETNSENPQDIINNIFSIVYPLGEAPEHTLPTAIGSPSKGGEETVLGTTVKETPGVAVGTITTDTGTKVAASVVAGPVAGDTLGATVGAGATSTGTSTDTQVAANVVTEGPVAGAALGAAVGAVTTSAGTQAGATVVAGSPVAGAGLGVTLGGVTAGTAVSTGAQVTAGTEGVQAAPLPLDQIFKAAEFGARSSRDLVAVITTLLTPSDTKAPLSVVSPEFKRVIESLQKLGIILPPDITPQSPQFIISLLNQVEAEIPEETRIDFRRDIVSLLSTLQVPQAAINLIQVESEIPIGIQVATAIAAAPLYELLSQAGLGLNEEDNQELLTLIATSFSPTGIVTAPTVQSPEFTKLIADLRKIGITLPIEVTPQSPQFITSLLDQIENKIPQVNQVDFHKDVVSLLGFLGVPKEVRDLIQVRSSAPLGTQLTNALAAAPVYQFLLTTPLSKQQSQELATLIGGALSPIGFTAIPPQNSPEFAKIASDLQKIGITLPTDVTPQSPQFIEPVLNAVEQQIPPAQRADFRNAVIALLQPLGLPEQSLNLIQTSSSIPIGTQVASVINSVPSTLIASLGINLTAIPPQTLANIETQVQTALPEFTSLAPADKAALVIAIGGGIITPAQATNIALSLATVDAQGLTISTATALIWAFNQEADIVSRIANAQAEQTRLLNELNKKADQERENKKAAIPPETFLHIKIAFEKLANSPENKRFVEDVVAQFAQTIVMHHNFYKFSIDFLLDPAKSFLKNFSILTADKGQTSNIIPV